MSRIDSPTEADRGDPVVAGVATGGSALSKKLPISSGSEATLSEPIHRAETSTDPVAASGSTGT
jgi:hypothetical protein